MADKQTYIPRGRDARLELVKRKARHEALNTFISGRAGWLTSVAGSVLMRFEAPIGSSLAAELRDKGYVGTPVGTTMRIIPNAQVEEIATKRSSMPPQRRETHAGIVETIIYEMKVP